MNNVTNINVVKEVKGLPCIDVPVFELIDNKPQYCGRVRKIYGVARFHVEPRIIESIIPQPKSSKELEQHIRSIAAKVSKIKPGMKLCPTHSNWIKIVNDKLIRVDLLFSLTGEDVDVKSRNFSRRNQLDFHLKDQSQYLGSMNVKVIRGNSPIEGDDGVVYIKTGTLANEPKFNPQKVICYSDFSVNQLKNQSPVIKGMAVIVSADHWSSFCKKLKVSDDFNAVVPEITVKYDDGRDFIECEAFSVFDTVISRKASLSIQAAERVPLTEYGTKIVEATFRERIREVMSAYADFSGLTVAKFINQEFKKMRNKSIYDADCFFMENSEVLGATYASLISGLPMNDSEYLNSTLAVLLQSRIKTISMTGLTIPVIPGRVKPFEIIMSSKEAYRLSINKGDRVTISRYPNTGIEMAEVTVVGFTHLSAVLIDPGWWSERFSGDFDGDLIGLLPVSGLIDESRVTNAISPKQKAKGEMNISEAVARAFYAKLLIPQADMLATICIEQGKDITFIRSVLQGCIDGIKHNVEFPDISKIKALLGIDVFSQPSPIAMLLRGKLGFNKKEIALKYGGLVGQLARESTSIQWMKNLEKEFRLIASANRKYAELALDDSKLIERYKTALIRFKQTDLINLFANRESSPAIPKELLAPYLNGAIRAVDRIKADNPESVELAHECYKTYQKWLELLRSDKPEAAFERLKDIREKIAEEKSGTSLRYLFIVMVYQSFELDPVFKIKSLKILSYFQMILGEYNLPGYIKALKYHRVFKIRIV
jgi:hypothetical protein